MANLNGKIGIVTGGGTGIGKATALVMAKAGAALVIGNRDAAKGVFYCMKFEIEQMLKTGGGAGHLKQILVPTIDKNPCNKRGIKSQRCHVKSRHF